MKKLESWLLCTDSFQYQFCSSLVAWKSATTFRLFWLQSQLLILAGLSDVYSVHWQFHCFPLPLRIIFYIHRLIRVIYCKKTLVYSRRGEGALFDCPELPGTTLSMVKNDVLLIIETVDNGRKKPFVCGGPTTQSRLRKLPLSGYPFLKSETSL